MSISERLRTVIARHLQIDPDDVTDQARIVEDLGADSLDIVEITMACEEEFSIDIPDQDMEEAKSVADLVQMIERAA